MDIGTLVASIGADIKDLERGVVKAKKHFKDLVKTSGKTTDDIEKDWKKLGSMSSESIKSMRKDVMASYTRIKKHADTTNYDTVRSRKLMIQKLKTLNLEYVKHIKNSLKDVEKAHSNSSRVIVNFMKGIAAAAATYLSFQSLYAVGHEIVETGIRLESLENAMRAVTGSAHTAGVELQFIADSAHNLGLNIRALEDSYKTLAAASMKTKLEGQGARDVFYAVAEASTAMQLTATQSHAALYALQQMMSKGRVQTEELRRQLGEQLPGAFQMAAEAMGVTTLELNRMLERGQVVSEDFLPKFAKVLHERFGKAAEKNAELARGAFNRLYNDIEEFKRVLAKSGLTKFFADVARVSSKVIKATTLVVGGESPETKIERLRKQLSLLKKDTGGFWSKFKDPIPGFVRPPSDVTTGSSAKKRIEAQIEAWKGVIQFQNKVAEHNRILLRQGEKQKDLLGLHTEELKEGAKLEKTLTQSFIEGEQIKADVWWEKLEKRREEAKKREEEEKALQIRAGQGFLGILEWRAGMERDFRQAELDGIAEHLEQKEVLETKYENQKLNNIRTFREADALSMEKWNEYKTQIDNEKLKTQNEFNEKYAEMGKSKFEIEREQLKEMEKAYTEACVDEIQLEKWVAHEKAKILKKELKEKLGMYQSTAGSIANTFQMVAQAGGKHSKEAFKMYKAFAMVEAAIGGAKAVLSAMGAPWPLNIIAVPVAAAAAAIQIGKIAASQPPSYDQGGISNARGIYQTGNIAEAHIPIPSGGRIPVEMKKGGRTVQIIMNNPVFQDLETQRQHMVQIADVVTRQIAPEAVVENYNNDGAVRAMVRGGA